METETSYMSRNDKRADKHLRSKSSITSTLPGGPHPSKASSFIPTGFVEQTASLQTCLTWSSSSKPVLQVILIHASAAGHPHPRQCCRSSSSTPVLLVIPSQCCKSSLASAAVHPGSVLHPSSLSSPVLSCISRSRPGSDQDHLWTLTERLFGVKCFCSSIGIVIPFLFSRFKNCSVYTLQIIPAVYMSWGIDIYTIYL